MARIYADEDISIDVVLLLREIGHDVVTADDAGMRRAPDGEQLLFASQHNRILLTHNLKDFRMLGNAWRLWSTAWNVVPRPEHSGVLAIRQKPLMTDEEAVSEIEALLASKAPVADAVYRWNRRDGWPRVA